MPIAFKKNLFKPRPTSFTEVSNGFTMVAQNATIYWWATGVTAADTADTVITAAKLETGVGTFGPLVLQRITAHKALDATQALVILRYGQITFDFPRPERTTWATPSGVTVRRYVDDTGALLAVDASAHYTNEGYVSVDIPIPVYMVYQRSINNGATPTLPAVGTFEATPYGDTGRIEYPEVATFAVGGATTHHLIKRWQVRKQITIAAVAINPWVQHYVNAAGVVKSYSVQ